MFLRKLIRCHSLDQQLALMVLSMLVKLYGLYFLLTVSFLLDITVAHTIEILVRIKCDTATVIFRGNIHRFDLSVQLCTLTLAEASVFGA